MHSCELYALATRLVHHPGPVTCQILFSHLMCQLCTRHWNELMSQSWWIFSYGFCTKNTPTFQFYIAFGPFLSPPVRMHGGLICITFCLSVWAREDAIMGCKSCNMVTGGVWTDLSGAKVTCWVQLVNWHADQYFSNKRRLFYGSCAVGCDLAGSQRSPGSRSKVTRV